MLIHTPPLLALLPLLPAAFSLHIPAPHLEARQAASVVSSVTAAAVSTAVAATGSAVSVASAASSFVGGSGVSSRPASSGAAAPSASASGSGSASPAQVTVYPYNSPAEGVTITGRRDPLGSDVYLGIPFGAPPTGALRWQPPTLPTWPNSTFSATRQPPSCLQPPNRLAGNASSSEDCLFLNVFTPAGANAQTAYLPVMVWAYGGGFTAGAASTYDSRLLVAAGSRAEKPFIVVVPNYRLGVLGFPYGKEAAENGAANLGIKDVQFALEWTRDNIWAWGGDPSRVTVAGQSAGAIIISHLLLQQDLDLFRSAIIQSGGASVSPIGPTESTWQVPFDIFAQAAGCKAASGNSTSARPSASGSGAAASASSAASVVSSGAASAVSAAQSATGLAARQVVSSAASAASVAGTVASSLSAAAGSVSARVSSGVATASVGSASASAPVASASPTDVWSCLKSKSSAGILRAQIAVQTNPRYGSGFIFAPSIDGDLIPSSPHGLLKSGQFRKVPLINGGVKDEGTIFVPEGISGPQGVPLVILTLEPEPASNATIQQVVQLYPYQDVAGGSPFNTGNETFGLDPAFKQASAVLGDATFQASRRWLTRNQRAFAPDVPVFSYFFNQTTPGADNATGVAHGEDVPYLFGAPFLGGNYTQADQAVSAAMASYWINFIYNQDPNGGANSTAWPAYGGSGLDEPGSSLQIQFGNFSVIRDDFREAKIAYFNSEPEQFNLKRSGMAKRAWDGF